MKPYQTIPAAAQAEFIEKKSRFIGRVMPVQTVQQAQDFIAGIKKEHWDATHNVWAYALRREQQSRFSDDGEPQGTAGMPVLDVLQKKEVLDCVVVVTRYFGGTLLGAGGLVRAYSQAASEAVQAAGVVTMAPCHVLRIACEYAFYGTLQRLIPACGGTVLSTDFGSEITAVLRLREEDAGSFTDQLAEKSGGKVHAQLLREEYAAMPNP